MGRGMQKNHVNIYQEKKKGGVICVQTIVTHEMGYFVHELKMFE